MDRRRLASFVALAEELHFRRAAERCHLTQPALSQQLKTLEDELQVALLYRTKRHVALTPAGRVLLSEARKILAQTDLAVALTQRTANGEIGQLFIGVTAPALFILVPEIVRRFRSQLPGIGLVVREMTAMDQEAALRSGQIDAGLLHPPLDDAELHCTEIARLPFALVLAEDNPLARRRTLRMPELAAEPFILFPRHVGPRLYDAIIGLCQSAGFSPRIVIEATPAQSIVAYAAAGLGVGWIASEGQHFARAGVVYRRLRGPAPELAIGLARRPEAMSPALAAFVAAAEAIGKGVR